MSQFKGYIQVYTGNGKGKTTAALGLLIRAVAHGFCCYVGQFMKGTPYGELSTLKSRFPEVKIEQFGRRTLVHTVRPEDYALARQGIEACLAAMLSGKYRIVVLDEINVVLHFKLLPIRKVLSLMEQKPVDVELVLTGRYAPKEIVKRADLVTEMKEIKHYYRKKIQARDGIER